MLKDQENSLKAGVSKRFPSPKSKKSPGGEEENEVHFGLPCGRQKG